MLRTRLDVRPLAVILIFVLVCVSFGVYYPSFLKRSNLTGIARQAGFIVLAAIGFTIVLAAGGFDMSVGAVASAAGVLAAMLLSRGYSLVAVIMSGVFCGAMFGVINALLIVVQGLPDIIGSVCTLLIATGLQFALTGGGMPIYLFGDKYAAFFQLGQGKWLGIPAVVWLMIGIAAVGFVLMHKSRYGFRVYAIGGNREAALVQGVSVSRLRFSAFVLSGMCAGLAGIFVASYSGAGIVQGADQYQFLSIISTYVGTVISTFGLVSVVGTVFGSFFIAVLGNILAMLKAPYFGEYLFRGIVLLVAVVFSRRR